MSTCCDLPSPRLRDARRAQRPIARGSGSLTCRCPRSVCPRACHGNAEVVRTETIESADKILIFAGDHREARAEVSCAAAAVDVRFHARSGHHDPQVPAHLVDAIFELPQLRDVHRLRASVPIGDAEIIRQLTIRCPALRAHAAGATCLIEADLDS